MSPNRTDPSSGDAIALSPQILPDDKVVYCSVSLCHVLFIGFGPVSESTKPPRSVFGRPRTEQLPANTRDYSAEKYLSPVTCLEAPSSKVGFLKKIGMQNWGVKRSGVSLEGSSVASMEKPSGLSLEKMSGMSHVVADSERSTRKHSSERRFSQRHQFLVDKIREERLRLDRPISAQI